jgi:hypothetical protein
VDEDHLCRLYSAAFSLLKNLSETRGLTRDQMDAILNEIHDDLMKDYDPSIVDN